MCLLRLHVLDYIDLPMVSLIRCTRKITLLPYITAGESETRALSL